jgi:hypothetical protein
MCGVMESKARTVIIVENTGQSVIRKKLYLIDMTVPLSSAVGGGGNMPEKINKYANLAQEVNDM